MSDEWDDLAKSKAFFEEQVLKRPLTPQGRAEFEKAWIELRDPPAVFRKLAERLKGRQGTIVPDFDALYRRKAELDNDHRP